MAFDWFKKRETATVSTKENNLIYYLKAHYFKTLRKMAILLNCCNCINHFG